MLAKSRTIDLNSFSAPQVITNRNFSGFRLPELERFYLPDSLSSLLDTPPIERNEFIEDDNRGAIYPAPVSTIDGTSFHLSVKGVGSTTDPFSRQSLTRQRITELVADPYLKNRIAGSSCDISRFITGELWLRGSPYGGQGVEHASIALRASEEADIVSINGFHIAPVVKIVFLPEELESQLKKIYWYRSFQGRFVQEIRLVPSNVRIYFHSGSTVGANIGSVFELFGIDTDEKAYSFEKNFIKSGIAMLTLFPRSLKHEDSGAYSGLDFYDVWLDKDAVLAPDGTVYFVDLEGIERVEVPEPQVKGKIEDQIFRSLYEFMFAYEQIERERTARFGNRADRKIRLEFLLRDALIDDPIIEVSKSDNSLILEIGNILKEQKLKMTFPFINW